MLSTRIEAGTNVVTVTYSGSLGADEMRRCRETLEEVAAEQGGLRLLARYGDVDLGRIELAAFWEDLKNTRLIGKIERCAIVADEEWIRRISDAAGRIIRGEIRTFTSDRSDEAFSWIRS